MGISTQRLILIVLCWNEGASKGNADDLKRLAAEVDAKLTAVANVLNAKSGKQKLAFKYLQELRLIPGPMMDRLMQAVVSRKSN